MLRSTVPHVVYSKKNKLSRGHSQFLAQLIVIWVLDLFIFWNPLSTRWLIQRETSGWYLLTYCPKNHPHSSYSNWAYYILTIQLVLIFIAPSAPVIKDFTSHESVAKYIMRLWQGTCYSDVWFGNLNWSFPPFGENLILNFYNMDAPKYGEFHQRDQHWSVKCVNLMNRNIREHVYTFMTSFHFWDEKGSKLIKQVSKYCKKSSSSIKMRITLMIKWTVCSG